MSGPGTPSQPFGSSDPAPLVSLVLLNAASHASVSPSFNILALLTCHLIRTKSAEMPPKVLPLFFPFDADAIVLIDATPRTRSTMP
jgi:hypothetical protein